MSLFALDTEFMEDGATIDLISLALVSDTGRTYYAQVVEAEHSQSNTFVFHNVIPVLTPCPGGQTKRMHWAHWSQQDTESTCVDGCPWRWKQQIAREVRTFVGPQPQFVTYYGAYDWVALCQLYGSMMALPQTWPMVAYDLRTCLNLWGHHAVSQSDDMPHHALSDAHWIMETWQRYAPHQLTLT